MTITVSQVSNNQSFGTWLQRTNDIIYILSNNAVTVNATASGSISTGIGYVNGAFGSNTLYATYLSGGFPSSNSTLEITSQLTVSNAATLANVVSITWSDGSQSTSLYNIIGANNHIPFNDSLSANTSTDFTFNKTSKILTVSNTVSSYYTLVGAGAQTAPSIYFSGNTSTGIYRPTTDTLAITAGGINKLTANSTAVVINDAIINSVNINNIGRMFANSYTYTTDAIATVDSIDIAVIRSAEYLIEASNSSPSYQMSKLLVNHDGTYAYITEYGMLNGPAGNLLTFSVDISDGNLRLRGTPVNAGDTGIVAKFVRIGVVL